MASYGEAWNSSNADFNRWYQAKAITGIGKFKIECKGALDKVASIMRNKMKLSVEEVIKGGSLGKGTMLKDIFDIDCVVMINSPDLPYLRDVSDMSTYVKRDLAKANRNIEKAIEDHASVVSIETNKYMVKTILKVSGVRIHVDLIPTADNLRKEGKHQIYESMLRRNNEDREYHSASLVKLQLNFIKSKPSNVKELIRLVKLWNSQVVGSALKNNEGPLPTSYPMELITVIAWERAGRPRRIKRLQGFKAILRIIATELPTLEKHWMDNYDESMVRRARSVMHSDTKRRPFILDPANPTNNVCARFHPTWNDVARVAEKTLQSNLLMQVHDSPKWKFSC